MFTVDGLPDQSIDLSPNKTKEEVRMTSNLTSQRAFGSSAAQETLVRLVGPLKKTISNMIREDLHDLVVCVGTTYPEAIPHLLTMVDTQKLLNTLRSKTIWKDPWSAFSVLSE